MSTDQISDRFEGDIHRTAAAPPAVDTDCLTPRFEAVDHMSRRSEKPSNKMPVQEHGYKHSAPFDSGMLPVGTIHQLHCEQYGNPDGKSGTMHEYYH